MASESICRADRHMPSAISSRFSGFMSRQIPAMTSSTLSNAGIRPSMARYEYIASLRTWGNSYLIRHSWTPADQSFWSWTSRRRAVVRTGANLTVFQASLAVPYGPAALTGSQSSPVL